MSQTLAQKLIIVSIQLLSAACVCSLDYLEIDILLPKDRFFFMNYETEVSTLCDKYMVVVVVLVLRRGKSYLNANKHMLNMLSSCLSIKGQTLVVRIAMADRSVRRVQW